MDVAINGQGLFRIAITRDQLFGDGDFRSTRRLHRQQQRRAAHRLSRQRERHHQSGTPFRCSCRWPYRAKSNQCSLS